MKPTILKYAVALAVSLPVLTGGIARADESLSNLWDEGKILLDTRLRHDYVDKQSYPEESHATTFRARYGFETGRWNGFNVLVEGESVLDLGIGRYDDGVSKRKGYPTIGDAEDTELNRAQISYESDLVNVIVGRQRIQLGNMRFVGNKGWRQNEQTFDAARLDLNLGEDLTLTYAYVDQVNRTDGDNAPKGRYQSDSHLGEVTYAFTPNFSAKAYSYLISLDEAPTVSTANYGLRLMADFPLGEAITFSPAIEYAHQNDYDNNPTQQSLDYYRAEANLVVDSWTLMLGAEVLGSDGTHGFSFPIASNHGQNGWADVFASKTPADGLVDFWVGATVSLGDAGPFKGIAATAILHDFSSDRGSVDYGQEADLGLKAKLPGGIGVGLVGETYGGADTFTDTNKVSFYLTFEL